MTNEQDVASLLPELRSNLKLMAALLATFEQREARMHGAMEQRLGALQDVVSRLPQKMDAIAGGASARIAGEAKAAIVPVAAVYERAVADTSRQLRMAGRTVWTWYIGLAALAGLFLASGWGLLGYYGRELAQAKDQLARHENAIQIAQAFHASDAVVCDGRLCVNVDPKARPQGPRRQYRPAKSR